MKTTIDIPDDLFRKIKVHAAIQGRTLKDLVVDALSRELAFESPHTPPSELEPTLYDRMKDLCGIIGDEVPADFASNPAYMDGFGD